MSGTGSAARLTKVRVWFELWSDSPLQPDSYDARLKIQTEPR
jgi:hypothetical protein